MTSDERERAIRRVADAHVHGIRPWEKDQGYLRNRLEAALGEIWDAAQAQERREWVTVVGEFLQTFPAMPGVEHVAGRYTWTADQYKGLLKLSVFYHRTIDGQREGG